MADITFNRDQGRVARRLSWGAVAVGVITAMVLQILFAILGTAIGLTAVDMNESLPRGLTTGAGLWWLITGLISLFAGGYVAASMAGLTRNNDGMLHGLVTWGLNLLLGVAFTALGTGALGNAGLTALTASDRARADQHDTGRGTIVAGERYEAGQQDQGANRASDRADAEGAKETAKKASWWVFCGLLLGAGASLVGGAIGVSSHVTPGTGRSSGRANQTTMSGSDCTSPERR